MTKVVFNIIALVLFATPAFAQVGTEDLEVTSLRGLQGVRVLVEQLRPELKRDGLTEDQLQTDAEIRLRKAGIPVLTEATLLNSLAKPFLYIQVQAFSPIADSYIFSTTVQLEQEVTLIRFLPQQRHRVIAPTWKDRGMGTVGAKNARSVRDHVGDSIDKFINSYLTANPRP